MNKELYYDPRTKSGNWGRRSREERKRDLCVAELLKASLFHPFFFLSFFLSFWVWYVSESVKKEVEFRIPSYPFLQFDWSLNGGHDCLLFSSLSLLPILAFLFRKRRNFTAFERPSRSSDRFFFLLLSAEERRARETKRRHSFLWATNERREREMNAFFSVRLLPSISSSFFPPSFLLLDLRLRSSTKEGIKRDTQRKWKKILEQQ